jgi:hypothetical protein
MIERNKMSTPPKCNLCFESMSGHVKPFSSELRSCEDARMYRKTPDPLFCRAPERCSTTLKCYSQERYDRNCND